MEKNGSRKATGFGKGFEGLADIQSLILTGRYDFQGATSQELWGGALVFPHMGSGCFFSAGLRLRVRWLKPLCAAGAKIAMLEAVLRKQDQKGSTTESSLPFGLQPRIVSETEGQEHKALGEQGSIFRGVNSF